MPQPSATNYSNVSVYGPESRYTKQIRLAAESAAKAASDAASAASDYTRSTLKSIGKGGKSKKRKFTRRKTSKRRTKRRRH